MKILYHKVFIKNYQIRISKNPNLTSRFLKRVEAFVSNPKDPILKSHPLTGAKSGLYSFSITGDIRVVYEVIKENIVLFHDIGTHNQVY